MGGRQALGRLLGRVRRTLQYIEDTVEALRQLESDGASAAGHGPSVIVESGKVDVLALIGSAKTAAVLLRQHPRPYRLRTILGMGRKDSAVATLSVYDARSFSVRSLVALPEKDEAFLGALAGTSRFLEPAP